MILSFICLKMCCRTGHSNKETKEMVEMQFTQSFIYIAKQRWGQEQQLDFTICNLLLV